MTDKEMPFVSIKRRPLLRRAATKVATAPAVVRDSVRATDFPTFVETWLTACDMARHTPLTISSRRERCGRLQWFATKKEYTVIGLTELRAFFHYLNHAHETGGRWDNPKCIKPLAAGRVKAFHSSLRTLFRFLEDEGHLDPGASPTRRIKAPIDRHDQIQPFTEADCNSLLLVAKQTTNPFRDTAIVSLLLDTGLRASELCNLTVADVLLDKGVVVVRSGKGGKKRSVPISAIAKRAVFEYIQREHGSAQEESEILFLDSRGKVAGDGISPHGLGQLFLRLGKMAKLSGVRCTPHVCRHTFAVTFLRGGGNSFTLQQMLGHESLAMTQKYVKIAKADTVTQHRQFSPLTHIKKKGNG